MAEFGIKKYLNWDNISSVFSILLAIYIFSSRYPAYKEASQFEGRSPSSIHIKTISGQILNIPEEIPKPAILIFWASWCAPCKVELSRYDQSIKDKEIPSENFFAINMGEDLQTVLQIQNEKKYHFQLFLDESGTASQSFHISTTPTVIHIDQNSKISWVGLGISPTAIYRAKKLFAKESH